MSAIRRTLSLVRRILEPSRAAHWAIFAALCIVVGWGYGFINLARLLAGLVAIGSAVATFTAATVFARIAWFLLCLALCSLIGSRLGVGFLGMLGVALVIPVGAGVAAWVSRRAPVKSERVDSASDGDGDRTH